MFVYSSTALARSRAQHTASPPSVHPVGWHVESRSDPSLQTMSISTRCSFKTSNIVPTKPPLPTPPKIYMHKLDICSTYIYTYIGLLPLPPSLAKAMPPQERGRPQAPRRRPSRCRRPPLPYFVLPNNPSKESPGLGPRRHRSPPPLPETPAKGQINFTRQLGFFLV